MRCNTYWLISCRRRRIRWITRVNEIALTDAQRVTARVRNIRSGKKNMIRKQKESPKMLNDIFSKQSHTQWVQQELNEDGAHEYTHCLRCGKKLKSAQSRLLGYGPTCQKKIQKKQCGNKLF